MLDTLLDALESDAAETRVTSVRQPRALATAIAAAVELGWAPTGNEGLNAAVRASLEAFARAQGLEEHLSRHPHLRPSLAEVALAVAELDHHPLAEEPKLIARAAREVVRVRPDADADDVLLWAMSLQVHRTPA